MAARRCSSHHIIAGNSLSPKWAGRPRILPVVATNLPPLVTKTKGMQTEGDHAVTKPLDLIRKLKLFRSTAKAETVSAFDKRMIKIDALRQTSVARAVLFKTRPGLLEA